MEVGIYYSILEETVLYIVDTPKRSFSIYPVEKKNKNSEKYI